MICLIQTKENFLFLEFLRIAVLIIGGLMKLDPVILITPVERDGDNFFRVIDLLYEYGTPFDEVAVRQRNVRIMS